MMRTKFVAATFVVLGLFAAPALAGEKEKQDVQKVWRASNLGGFYVKNGSGDNAQTLGHMEDMVIDLRSGQVIYYAMSHGQTLGLGGKMFAIHPESIRFSPNQDYFVLEGVTNEELDNAQGFDANKWPTEPDKRWSKGKGKVEKKVEEGVKEGKQALKGKPQLARMTALNGSTVRTAQNKDLGSIYDLAIYFDGHQHMVSYVAISHGGTLGVGGKLYPVPLDKLQISSPELNPNQRTLTLHVTEEQLKNLNGFTSGQDWPTRPDQNFWKNIKSGRDEDQGQ